MDIRPHFRNMSLLGKRIPRVISFFGLELAFGAVFFATSAPSGFLSSFQRTWDFPGWLLTFAFGIYAIALLLSLLTVGSLSDIVGRRPVIMVSLLAAAASMIILMEASNIQMVIVARVAQGLATGAATGAISSSLIELTPLKFPRLGGLLATVTPLAGQAIGGLVTGIVLADTLHPAIWIFGSLAAVFLLSVLIVLGGRDTVARRPGLARSLLPQLVVPPGSRTAFAAGIPVLVTTWMIGGLYLGLLPALMPAVFRVADPFITGLLLTLLMGLGAAATIVGRSFSGAHAAIFGEATIIFGAAGVVGSVVSGSLGFLIAATAVTGVGFGLAFSGAMSSILVTATPESRSGLFSAIYVVSYLALGLPAIASGIISDRFGLTETAEAYGVIILLASVLGLLAQARAAGRSVLTG